MPAAALVVRLRVWGGAAVPRALAVLLVVRPVQAAP